MPGIPHLEDAAKHLEGVIFVLRLAGGSDIVIEYAQGRIGPLSFGNPALNQQIFEQSLASMDADKRNAFMAKMVALFNARGPVNTFLEVVFGGTPLNIEIKAEVTESGAGVFMAGYARDRTQIERLGAHRKMVAALTAAVQLFPDMVWLKDSDGRYVLSNDMFDRFNGVASGYLIGKTPNETLDSRAKVHEETDLQAMQSTEIITFERQMPDQGGGLRYFDVRKLALRDEHGKAAGILGTARETTSWRRLENELRQSEEAYRSLTDNIPDKLLRVRRDLEYVFMNHAMREFFEIADYPSPEQIRSGHFEHLPNGQAAAKITSAIKTVFDTDKGLAIEVSFLDRTGRTHINEIRWFPEFGSHGRLESVLGIGRDVTARKEIEKRLARSEAELHMMAFTDSLTGLQNRRSFQTILEDVLNASKSGFASCALLLLDIDRFKYVNDTLGHAVGDELIVAFAKRLAAIVGEAGEVCRLGGDEFAIVLPSLKSRAQAENVAERIHEALHSPVRVSVDTIAITTSIGIAFGSRLTKDQNELFRFADLALYAAKSAGRARTTVYDSDMARKSERRFELEALIAAGLRNKEFQAYFQCKNDLQTGRIIGAEALCRWIRTDGQMISPAEFIPVAEETGQIIELGRSVLMDACRFAVEINAGSAEPIPVSVNVSARQLLFGGFIGTLGTCLEQTGCAGGWLELELTESLLLGDDSVISDTLKSIVALGVSLTIDDFGTGYSSLSYLARFPISALKIDQAFVRNLDSDDKNAVLCRAIISMAQGLGLKTVAEGIETREIAERLKSLGCETGQGYFWGRPEPAEKVRAAILKQEAGKPRARA